MTHFFEPNRYPNALPSLQLLLLFVFLAAYVAAVSGFFGERGRLRAGAVALLAAIGLGLAFQPWTIGALLVAACIGGIGLFIAFTLLLSRALGVDGRVTEPAAPLPARGAERSQPGFNAHAAPRAG